MATKPTSRPARTRPAASRQAPDPAPEESGLLYPLMQKFSGITIFLHALNTCLTAALTGTVLYAYVSMGAASISPSGVALASGAKAHPVTPIQGLEYPVLAPPSIPAPTPTSQPPDPSPAEPNPPCICSPVQVTCTTTWPE